MKYYNGYRVDSARLKNHDYSSPGLYYVTFNTKHFKCWFGRIKLGKMEFSEAGKIAYRYFHEIPEHFHNVALRDSVIMPNHIHAIIQISSKKESNGSSNRQSSFITGKNRRMSEISPKAGSLPVVIRSYKSAVTRTVRKIIPEFKWHERYYDRIIRVSDPGEIERISKYINENPINWYKDELSRK